MRKNKLAIMILIMNTMLVSTGCGTDTAQEEQTQTAAEEVSLSAEDAELAASIDEILNNDDYYPDITAIDYNESYSEFTITLAGDTMNMYESMLVMSFYTYGNERQVESGVSEEDALTVVRYVNGATGDVISESDSSSMVTE